MDNVLLSVQKGQVVILSGRATFYMQTMGENPPTRANHPPTPGISPKWVNRLFFVILWPVDGIVLTVTVPQRDKDDVSHIICVRSGLAHSDNTTDTSVG